MHVTARTDYAVRAMLTIAASTGDGQPVKMVELVEDQHIPSGFLREILQGLCCTGLLISRRGQDGGYLLARPADDITVGDILRAANGALFTVRGQPAEQVGYRGVATGLDGCWRAVHAALAGVVDRITLTDLLMAGHGRPAANSGHQTAKTTNTQPTDT
jgi:Rrf2 family protein